MNDDHSYHIKLIQSNQKAPRSIKTSLSILYCTAGSDTQSQCTTTQATQQALAIEATGKRGKRAYLQSAGIHTSGSRSKRKEEHNEGYENNTHSHGGQNTHLAQKKQRSYLHIEEILNAANTKFSKHQKGLTYRDLYQGPFKMVETSRQAKEVLYYHKDKNNLFTGPRTTPQQYFATKEQAELASLKNTHSQPTGVQRKKMGIFELPRTPLSNVLDQMKARDFYHALLLTEAVPLGIHNIRLDFILADRDAYDSIQVSADLKDNRAKKFERRVGDALVKYKVSPRGKVEISIVASEYPFRLETEQDVTELFGFVAGVRDYLLGWISDTSAKIVPLFHSWRLIHADLNKDVPVTEIMGHTKPNIELKIAERVFRLYVKTIGHENFFRVEEMRAIKAGFDIAIHSIMEGKSRLSFSLHPAAFLEVVELKSKIASLTEQLAQMQELVTNLIVKNENGLARRDIADSNKMIVSPTTTTACDNNSEQRDSTALYQRNQRWTGRASKEQQVSGYKPEEIVVRDNDAVEMISASSLYERQKSKPRITTGSKSLDDLFGGGLEVGAVTELYGEAGSGKTQLCLTLAATAQQDLLPSHSGRISKVLFIDTENTFTSRRISKIAKARGFDPDSIVKNIYLRRAKNASNLQVSIENWLPEFLEKDPDIRLLVVDSLVSRHCSELIGCENLSQWQQSLNAMIQSLKRLADKFEIAVVVVTNQVVEYPDSYLPDTTTQAAVDSITAHAGTHRLMLKLTGKSDRRIATMVYSPCYPARDVPLMINHQGIVDEST